MKTLPVHVGWALLFKNMEIDHQKEYRNAGQQKPQLSNATFYASVWQKKQMATHRCKLYGYSLVGKVLHTIFKYRNKTMLSWLKIHHHFYLSCNQGHVEVLDIDKLKVACQ